MRTILQAATAVVAFALAGTALAECKHKADRAGGLDLAGIERVVIRAGPGDLKVVGSPNARRLEARGVACASSGKLLERIRLEVFREGNVAYVEASVEKQPGLTITLFGDAYAYLDLGIALPDSLPVDARDSSGDAVFEGLRQVRIEDSSGDLRVERIAGHADIRDSSGDVIARDVGSVRLDDSSGDVEIARVAGHVEVPADSSGDLRIEEVGGNVHVRNDSSGDIRIAGVRGDVTIDVDGSGAILVERVDGNLTVGADGSGDVVVHGIKGTVSLPR
jgi:hypothetical protein